MARCIAVLTTLLTALVHASPLPDQILEKRQSSIPYGSIIRSCSVPGTVAITFDDGPYIYTPELLDLLSSNGVPATFFVNGQNYGSIYDNSAVIQRMVNEGHQVASHTWSHADLSTLDEAGIVSQMEQLETALTSIIGFFPQYMRSPYFAYSDLSLSTLGNLGYHVIECDIDTLDYENNSPTAIQNSVTIYQNGLDSGGTIDLAHDPLPDTVNTLAQKMIDAVRAKGLNPVTIGACLGDSPSNWYRTGR